MHAHQDLHKLFGVERFSLQQKRILNALALEVLDAMAAPREELLAALIPRSSRRGEPDE